MKNLVGLPEHRDLAQWHEKKIKFLPQAFVLITLKGILINQTAHCSIFETGLSLTSFQHIRINVHLGAQIHVSLFCNITSVRFNGGIHTVKIRDEGSFTLGVSVSSQR